MPHLFITLLTSLSLLLGQSITPVSAAVPVYTAETANEAISSEIGTQAKVGELTDGEHGIGTATQLGLHALTGCASAALQSGDCGTGALGQVTGEVVGMLYNEYTDMADIDSDGDGSISATEEAAWKSKGVELAGNVTQAVLTATGADAHDIAIGTTNTTTAAENNALGIVLAGVAVAAYLTAEGDGNPLDGLEKVGAGEDTVSTAVGEAVEAGVDYGMEHHPEATVAVLGTLSEAGEAVDATFTYLDDATGNVVSDNWNELPPETQNRLAGALIIGSSVIPGASAKILTKTPEVDKIPETTNDKMVGRDKGYNETELNQIDPKTKDRFDRLNQNDRTGKDFTKSGKENVRDINRELNGGVEKCEGCGLEVIDPKQSQKGVTPSNNEANVDHIKRKSEGGSGTPDNGQVLCRECNVNEKH